MCGPPAMGPCSLRLQGRRGSRTMSQVELQPALRAVIRSISLRGASGREAIFGASRHRRRHDG